MSHSKPVRANSIRGRKRALAGIFAVTALAALSACQTTVGPSEGIRFKQERYREIAAMEQHRNCVVDAMKLDAEARKSRSAGGFLASAKLFEKCESQLGPEAAHVGLEERMRAYAVGIVNYVKGGDLGRAQKNLGRFETAFKGQDLYLANGASFIDTMDLLTGRRSVPDSHELSMLNVGPGIGSELERIKFWKRK